MALGACLRGHTAKPRSDWPRGIHLPYLASGEFRKYHLACLLHITHERQYELRLLTQGIDPSSTVSSVVIEDALIEPEDLSESGGTKLSDQFLFGIERIAELLAFLAIKAVGRAGGVYHLVKYRGVELLSVFVYLFRSGAELKLLLLGYYHYITCG